MPNAKLGRLASSWVQNCQHASVNSRKSCATRWPRPDRATASSRRGVHAAAPRRVCVITDANAPARPICRRPSSQTREPRTKSHPLLNVVNQHNAPNVRTTQWVRFGRRTVFRWGQTASCARRTELVHKVLDNDDGLAVLLAAGLACTQPSAVALVQVTSIRHRIQPRTRTR